jgi:hypothetical protein
VTVKTKRGLIKPRSPNQAQYIANIVRHDICFGIGPPGPARPISPWPPPWMRWSARRSAASC